MSEYKKVKLGDIFTLEKGSLQSSKCTPGQYDFITAAEDWKTHESYTHDCEAIVYAVAASGSLGRAHYVNGKFIASDLCFIMQEKDKEKYPVNFQFYQIIFEVLRDEIVSKTKTGTSKESISQKNLSKYEIPYFDYDFQIANYERLVRTKQIIAEILKETESQKAYIKQLRQNILQDAIEGKLTAEWRKTHPVIKGNPDFDAEALFEEIQKGKAFPSLQPAKQSSATPSAGSNAARNVRSKELPPITDDEKPFEIPEGWKWVRLGEITTLITDGKHGDSSNQSNSGFFFLSAKDIQNEQLVYTNAREITEKDFYETHRRTNLEPGDICIVNTGATVGKLAIAPDDEKTYRTTFQKSVAVIKIVKKYINNEYMKYFLMRDVPRLMEKSWGSAINNLLLSEMRLETVPLPPCEEQSEIIIKVARLLDEINQLEQRVLQQEEYANQLMKNILKDAFEEK